MFSPRLALLTGLTTLALAATAHADSIVYTNTADNNIWVAAPDGTNAHAVTKDGSKEFPWRNPSQADDGTVMARRGTQLFRFDRQGKQLSKIDTPAGGSVGGPFDPKLSPDGKKVAYEVYVQTRYETPGDVWLEQGSYVIWQDAVTGAYLGDFTPDFGQPSWLADSQHALLFDPNTALTMMLAVGPVGATNKGDVDGWLRSTDNPIGAGELNRQETRLALLQAAVSNGSPYYDNGNSISLYGVHGHTGEPDNDGIGCEIGASDGKVVRDPSWAPTGDALAWWDNAGIWTSKFDGTCASIAPVNVIKGAGQEDWGPAEPGNAAVDPTPTPTPTPTPSPTPTPAITGKPSKLTTKRTKKAVKVTVTATAPTTATIVVKAGKRRVAALTAKVGTKPTTTRVALPKQARKHKLTVKVTAGGATLSRKA